MEEWKEYKLGELTDRKIGYGIVQPGENIQNGIPIIKVNNIISGLKDVSDLDRTSPDNDEKYKRTRLKGGEIIISIVGTIGKTTIVPKSFAGSNLVRATALIDIADDNKTLWVKYYIDSPQGQAYIKENLNTTVQPTLNIKSLIDMPIRFYSTDYMNKATSILKSLDDKIEVNRRINEQLEELAGALFKSWFVDFEPFKDGEFVDSELGMIPKGWKVGTLSDILYISKESVNPSKMSNCIFQHYSIPAYDNGKREEIQEGNTILSNKFKIDNKTTLFSKLNPRIKRVWFVDEVGDNSICSTEFIPYKAKDKDLVYFVNNVLSSDYFYNKIMSIVNGATGSHQRFHPKDTLNFKFTYDMEVAKEYNNIVKPIITKILKNQQEITHLSTLRDTLLPKLMSGEIDVNEVGI